MKVIQLWLAGLIGLGALYIISAPDSHIATAVGAGQKFISGTEKTAITGK